MDIKWEIVQQEEAVIVIPCVDKNNLLLINQYRHTIGKYIWEFPAGRKKRNEDVHVCAQRELGEECGYHAAQLQSCIKYYPSPGVSTEIMHLCIAQKLEKSCSLQPDADEIITTEVKSLEDIEEMILTGKIEDAKTILAFFYYKYTVSVKL